MNRTEFYARIRPMFGGTLSQRQVDGIEALLAASEGLPISHAAHVLAEAKHETGGGMFPVKETVYAYSKNQNPTDAQVIKSLDTAFSKGQLSWVKTPYWRGGWFARGIIQITHEDNYRKMSPIVGADLVANPALALDLKISAKIAVEGCARGIFRGHKLADYNGPPYDHRAARNIVNGDGTKKQSGSAATIGQAIAQDARTFEDALRAADLIPDSPKIIVNPTKPAHPTPSLWASIWTVIFNLIKGKR